MGISEFMRNYNERFSFDPRLNKMRKIGVSIDYPVVRKDNYRGGSAIGLLRSFASRERDLNMDKLVGEVTSVEKNQASMTCGMGSGILEVSIPPQFSLWAVASEHKPLVSGLYGATRDGNDMLLGYGAQPVERNPEWANREFYRVLRESLGEKYKLSEKTGKSYGETDKLALVASSRAYVEVGREEFGKALTVLNAVSPFISALFGNSPLCLGANATGDRLTARDMCFARIPEKRTAFPADSVEDMEDYLRYMTDLGLLVAEGNTTYFAPDVTFSGFVRGRSEDEAIGNFFLHERTMWWTAVPSGETGTIMVQTCTQPHGDQLSFAAFILGIAENLDAVYDWLEIPEAWVFLLQLDKYAAQYGLSERWGRLDNYPFHELLAKLLAFSEEGLKRRDMSENMLLAPLWDRLQERKNPAEKAMNIYSELGASGWLDLLSHLARI